jgi:murein DD-endopeptidase MepM/ murein hydrolase activator NlpD
MKMIPKKPTLRLNGLVSLLLAFALLVVSLPQPAAAQTCSRNHTVAAGETVSNIAETYKITTAELAAANNLKEPYTIYVGQVLCIPASSTTTTTTTTGGSSSTNKTTPELLVAISGNKILISADNYPKQNTYYVKAGEKGFKYGQWIRLGRVRSRKDGSIDATFLFPKSLRNSRVVEVCLKNITNDDVACKRIAQSH